MSHPEIKSIATHIMARLRTRTTDAGQVMDVPDTPEPADNTTTTGHREQAISKRAYELWLERGCPEGSPEEDWYRAESEMKIRGHSAAGSAPGDA